MSEQAAQTQTTTTETASGKTEGAAAATETKTEVTSIIAAPEGGEKKPDAKTEGAPKADAKIEAKVEDKPYAITIPKELEQHTDKAELEKFTAWAKEKGFTPEQATELAVYDIQRAAAMAKSQDEAVDQKSREWLDEVKADKDLGGAKLASTIANAHRAIVKFGGEQLAKDLKTMGLENHPGLVRFANAVGAALLEDRGSIQGGGAGSGARRESIYDP